jgi:hypothetical protein
MEVLLADFLTRLRREPRLLLRQDRHFRCELKVYAPLRLVVRRLFLAPHMRIRERLLRSLLVRRSPHKHKGFAHSGGVDEQVEQVLAPPDWLRIIEADRECC